jgi:hypothetical protein
MSLQQRGKMQARIQNLALLLSFLLLQLSPFGKTLPTTAMSICQKPITATIIWTRFLTLGDLCPCVELGQIMNF